MTISSTTQGLKPGVCTSSNRPANPYDGMMIYETDTDKTLVYHNSAWNPPWNLAWGKVGQATSTTIQSGVSTIVDITGMSVTFTAISGRQYKTTLFLPQVTGTSGDRAKLEITDGSNTTLLATYTNMLTNGSIIVLSYLSTGSGSITHKARMTRDVGSGTIQSYADSVSIRHLLVEDIGPA